MESVGGRKSGRTNVYRDFRPNSSSEKRPDRHTHPLSLDVPLNGESRGRKQEKRSATRFAKEGRLEDGRERERETNESDVKTTHSRHENFSSSVESSSETVLPDVLDVV